MISGSRALPDIYESTGEIRVPLHDEYYLKRKTNNAHYSFHGKKVNWRGTWEIHHMWCCEECSPDWGKKFIIVRKQRNEASYGTKPTDV